MGKELWEFFDVMASSFFPFFAGTPKTQLQYPPEQDPSVWMILQRD
jgi:hypothetical protein